MIILNSKELIFRIISILKKEILIRRKIEIERIDPDCFLAFQTFREFSLDFFFDDNFKLERINI